MCLKTVHSQIDISCLILLREKIQNGVFFVALIVRTNVLLSDCYFSNKRAIQFFFICISQPTVKVSLCTLCLGVAEMQLYAQLTQYSSLGVIHHEEERHTKIAPTKAL